MITWNFSFTILMCKSFFLHLPESLKLKRIVTFTDYTCLWKLSVGSFLGFRAWSVSDSWLGLCMTAFLLSRRSNSAQISSRLISKVHSIFSNKKLPTTFRDNPNSLYCLQIFFELPELRTKDKVLLVSWNQHNF